MEKKTIRYLLQFIQILPKKCIIVFLSASLLTLIAYGLDFLLPLLQKNFIDTALTTDILTNKFLAPLICIVGVLFIIQILNIFISVNLQLKMEKQVFKYYFEKILYINKDKLLQKGTGYYYDTLSQDAESVLAIFEGTLFSFLYSVVKSVLIIILVLQWNPVLFITLLITYSLTIGISILIARLRKKQFALLRNASAQFVHEATDIFSNNFIIKVFAVVQKFKQHMVRRYSKLQHYSRKTFLYQSIGNYLISITQMTAFLFLLVFSLHLILKGQLTYGMLIAVINYFFNVFTPINNFFSLLQVLNSAEVSLKRLRSVEEDAILQTNSFSGIFFSTGKFNNLKLKDVTFGYNNNKQSDVLSDICISLYKGEKLGIVGLSGEGKSSFLKLLLREILPQKGLISINNNNIQQIPYLYFLNRINIMPQYSEIFNRDLMFNLTLGNQVIDENADTNLIRQHCRNDLLFLFKRISAVSFNPGTTLKKKCRHILALLKSNDKYTNLFKSINLNIDFKALRVADHEHYLNYVKQILSDQDNIIRILTGIYFNTEYIYREKIEDVITLLGLEKLKDRELGEKGMFISGGEKSRISFARFLLKEDFDFFILDEPFISLDSKNESKLVEIAKARLAHKPGIVISHKFNVLLNLADEFLVLEEGKINSRGTHTCLLKTNETYRELYENFVAHRTARAD